MKIKIATTVVHLWLSKKGCYERPDMLNGHMINAGVEMKPKLVVNG